MKEEILLQIKRISSDTGHPPGRRTFEQTTGICESDWQGIYWARWGDAVREAGLEPNLIQQSYDDEYLLKRYCDAALHFESPPTRPEMRIYARKFGEFPSYTTYQNHFGTMHKLRVAARSWALGHEEYSAILSMIPKTDHIVDEPQRTETTEEGWVYLLNSGTYYKIGRSENVEKRVKQISIALPHKVTLIHAIKTDDPAGIEAYWHRRFENVRANGEWFALSKTDVRAFKRRRFQ